MKDPFTEEQSDLIKHLTIHSILFCGFFFLLEYRYGLDHELAVFLSFFLLPFCYLVIFEYLTLEKVKDSIISTLRSFGTIDLGFFEGLAIYLIFSVYILIYAIRDPEFFDDYDKIGRALAVSLFITALNVIPIDFFTKRIIQYSLMERFPPRTVILLTTIVWLLAHIPESLWLNELMGNIGVWIFLLFSGLITSISYQRTKNVWGQMSGHVLLNFMVALFAHYL